MATQFENRELRARAGLTIRSGDKKADTAGTIIGYAAVFSQPSEDLGFREIIKPGAFTRTLKEGPDVRALFDHDSAFVIGRQSAKTLTLREDDKGLLVEIDVADTQAGRDLLTSVRRGDITGMSFGFRVRDHEWVTNSDGTETRILKDIELHEVSVVAWPAYTQTTAEARAHTTRAKPGATHARPPATVRAAGWRQALI